MSVKSFFASVFTKQDDARKAMTAAVTQAREELEAATARLDRIVTNRMEGTIGEMLDENDKVTGRRRDGR